MIELLTAEPNLPFTAALGVMAALAVIEGLGLILGASPSNLSLLDSLLQEVGLSGGSLDDLTKALDELTAPSSDSAPTVSAEVPEPKRPAATREGHGKPEEPKAG